MKRMMVLMAMLLVVGVTGNAQFLKEVEGVYYAEAEPYTGIFKSYHDNYNLKLEMNLVEGMKNGEVKIYFEDGTLNEIRSYKNNLMHGIWVTYNLQGKKIAEARYADGKKEGTWQIWDENGVLRTLMVYSNGNKSGTWKRWDENGQLIGEKIY
jgi:YD repeat-containing protein